VSSSSPLWTTFFSQGFDLHDVIHLQQLNNATISTLKPSFASSASCVTLVQPGVSLTLLLTNVIWTAFTLVIIITNGCCKHETFDVLVDSYGYGKRISDDDDDEDDEIYNSIHTRR
jgi:hypothetical protein